MFHPTSTIKLISGLIDCTVAGVKDTFTPPQDFHVRAILTEVVEMSGVSQAPNVSMGQNDPDYDDYSDQGIVVDYLSESQFAEGRKFSVATATHPLVPLRAGEEFQIHITEGNQADASAFKVRFHFEGIYR